MNFRTKQYLRKRFQDYYNNSDLPMPHDFRRREWGFILFDQMPEVIMRRHKAFSSEGEAVEYIRGMVPVHLYHSAAYYEHPGAGTMKEKKWNGADLIFDLDADHLPSEVRGRSYKDMLEAVKKETDKLLKFLLDDFGFTEDSISIVFSGGRGYHIHVRDPKVISLDSAERREIVDYIGGKGLDPNVFFKKSFMFGDHGTGTRTYKGETKVPIKWVLKNYDSGWGKRIAEFIAKYLNDESMKDDNEMFTDLLQMKGVGKKTIKSMKQLVTDGRASQAILDKGQLDFGYVENFKEIIAYFIEQSITKYGVVAFGSEAQVDEPVTADIKRLIRVPSSLHGGSGMKVVPLTLAEFRKFEPLNDAVVFSSKEVDIEIIPPLKPQNSKVEMKGKSFTVSEGINTLPEYAAIYLMCRGAAEYA